MFCNYCGAHNPEVASFCRGCGKAIVAKASLPISAPVPDVATSFPLATPSVTHARDPRSASAPKRFVSIVVVVVAVLLVLAGSFILMRTRTGSVRTLKGHSSYISSVAFGPDGRMVASGSSDGTVKLWDAATGKLLRTLKSWNNTDWISISHDGRLLASSGGSSGKGFFLWDTSSGNLIRTLASAEDSVGPSSFSPDGRFLAASVQTIGSSAGVLKVWELPSDTAVRSFSGYGGIGVFSPDGKALVTVSANKSIVLLDIESGSEARTFARPSAASPQQVVFSPDGRWLAATTLLKSTILVWDVASGSLVRTISDSATVRGIAFSPDSRLMASGNEDHSINLWDVASGTKVRTLSGHSDSVNAVAFSPDGRWLVSGSADTSVRLWPLSDTK